MRPRWKKMIFMVPAAIVGISLFIAIGGQVVMHLWNWLLPMLFGWRPVTFWQAIGVLALCRILFGAHGFRGQRHRDWSWRRRWAERWEKMTPEEREKFRDRMGGCCGSFGPTEAK